MSIQQPTDEGFIYTFYSYKGGSGRSMAVANTAALLAKWGHSVLVVDWDLEAPGIERFFVRPASTAASVAESKPGVVDLVCAVSQGPYLNWADCVHTFGLDGSLVPVSLISAGRRGPGYVDQVQRLDFPLLFSKHNLGAYIEELRKSWVSAFEFVLIDSRTGVTDIGGICTVHLADALILLFTSTDSSVEGAIEIINRARQAREHLPLDRGKLLAVPLPSRDESRTEYERAAEWKRRFGEAFRFLYKDWLPSESMISEAIEVLKLPYVPYWSFGERLPALEESPSDPAGLAYAYELLARLLVSKLDWNVALQGRALFPPSRTTDRRLDDEWAARHRKIALDRLSGTSRKGFVELYHCCVNSPIDRLQDQLLLAARQAMVHTFGWPIGVVLDRDDARPRPTNDGIVAEVKTAGFFGVERKMYDYWVLTRSGDFFTLMSLYEDDLQENAIFFDSRIVRATEGLLHCANLYRALGADSRATIQLRITYGGLRGRQLKSARVRPFFDERTNLYEEEVTSEVVFQLNQLETEITQLVIKLCSPLFMLFDFFNPPEGLYLGLVKDFVAGKIA